jgi:protein-tyrosine phosphatase
MRTSELLRPRAPGTGRMPPQVTEVLFRVHPEFLEASFEAIAQDHGSIDAFLRDALGMDDAAKQRLRELYLPRS